MAAGRKIVFAQIDSTVHFKLGEGGLALPGHLEPHESRVVPAGTIIDPDEIPDYLLELIKQGKAPGLSLLSEESAKKIQRDAAIARGDHSIIEEEIREAQLAE